MTDKQRRFVEEYPVDFNATQAAIRAGYSKKTAYSQGQRLLKDVESVKKGIRERMEALAMSAEEALVRLSEQAEGAYAPYIQDDGTVDVAGIVRDGKSHLIKGTKFNAQGRLEVQFHDAQAALRDIAKIRGLFVDRVDHTSGGKPFRWFDPDAD